MTKFIPKIRFRQNGNTLKQGALFLGALAATAFFAEPQNVQAQEVFPSQVHIAAGERASGRILNVGIGRSVVINLAEDAADVLISNPEIADAVLRTPRRIFVLGNTAGQSRLVLFGRSGRELASFSIRVEKDTSDITRIIRRLVPGANVSAESINGNIVLSGTAKSTIEAQQAADIAAKFQGAEGAAGIVNLISVSGSDQVHLKVTVAEVERSIIKQLGVRFSGSISAGNYNPFGDSLPSFNVNPSIVNQATAGVTFATGATSLTAQVDALQRDGVIRTLAEPTLTAISGENASFLAGGEFPIPIAQEDNKISVEFKKFGVGLDFTPVVLSGGRISLRVKTEVSELSNEGAVSAGGITISALKVRRAESTMELPSGGTLVMAGLLKESYQQAIEGVPGLMQLPVIGALFKSRDFLKQQTELAVFVTPYAVRPVAAQKMVRPDKNLFAPSDAETVFLNRLNKIFNPAGQQAEGTYHGQVGFIYK
ncbi:type II and III secretion system protein family protein [Labrenzia sp. PHM005]|uniref:type II and III secretion system protein family protein n=1 Tax=Labrenzia sp. PHM005 TaxID=2590016 RepID=UPI00113FD046|nr:type II and III secretion system protein family protein [Labrenzia sp. PHM005]QDG74491.1 type II and III secretion system protein family protein [Labrenzia sp. PHM005]